jgi:hypothetical protein
VDDLEVTLAAIYGPNTNDFRFFESLTNFLQDNANTPIICEGTGTLPLVLVAQMIILI